MIVICEECGKKYRIDPAKIPEKGARFKCKSCSHTIEVSKPKESVLDSPSPPPMRVITGKSEEKPTAEEPVEREKTPRVRTPKRSKRKPKGMGLRIKMALLFVLIPIIFVAGAGVLYLWQLNTLTSDITNVTSNVVTQIAEQVIQENARAVAKQCKLYLMSHPEFKKEDFIKNEEFRKVAVQKVGISGYSALYELPDANGVWRTWAHVNPKIIAIDMSKLKKPLGRNFPGFWKVYTGVKGGKESRGYYTWKDADGSVRDKFMVCTPIEGTRYIIASTTYLDEFTRPMKNLEIRAKNFFLDTRAIVFGIMGATLVLITLIVSIYGARLTQRIKSLTDVADRISVGELDAEIDIRSKDEIGDLGEAVARMQDSIRLSIERLRRRR
ncbi:MAG: zinc-ribbon domain-containing protein [Desulfobacteraceae bacterium]|nr:MAG: zinc-ribbon domain-containing protein [Desulfobacteraceae bacterium]